MIYLEDDEELALKNKDDERKKRTKLKKERDELAEALKMAEVRKYLWRLMSDCNVFSSTFNVDHSRMAFQEGMRAVGLNIMTKIIEASPESWALMQKENLDD